MHLVIDAHNLRSGGGRTYVYYLLKHTAAPHPFTRISVVCPPDLEARLSQRLPGRPWLTILPIDHLARSLVARRMWHDHVFPNLLRSLRADVLFAPGGVLPKGLPRDTTAAILVQNMLLFQRREAARYGPGLEQLRIKHLRRRVFAAIEQADGIIFPSTFGRYMATLAVPRARGAAAVISNGVDPRFRAPTLPGRYGRPPRRLLYVSTLDVYKHQDVVIDALHRLDRRSHPRLRLHLVGPHKQPMLGRVQAAIDRAGLRDAVTLQPWVSHDTLPALYQGADIGIFASSCETCPNILLEMMASGLPVVCSNRPPMPDFCLDGAVYADPEDADALSHAIARLLEDRKARERTGRALAERARAYDWSACALETLSFLGQVARARR